jgi:hypothetical protein
VPDELYLEINVSISRRLNEILFLKSDLNKLIPIFKLGI